MESKNLKCLWKNRKCEHAGKLIIDAIKEYDGIDGMLEYTVCYHPGFNFDYSRCEYPTADCPHYIRKDK